MANLNKQGFNFFIINLGNFETDKKYGHEALFCEFQENDLEL